MTLVTIRNKCYKIFHRLQNAEACEYFEIIGHLCKTSFPLTDEQADPGEEDARKNQVGELQNIPDN